MPPVTDRTKPRAPFAPWDRRELPGLFSVEDTARRVGNYKWVESEKARGLFDLASDLGEQHDLSTEKPEVLANMQARFAAWQREMEAAEPRPRN